jgi:nitrogen regulatory protein P-II 1
VENVREALLRAEIFRITVSRCTGRGQAQEADLYRGQEVAPDLLPKVRIEIACNDEFIEPCIKAIVDNARHGENGEIGDGKIFVSPLEECVRIRTGARGIEAV